MGLKIKQVLERNIRCEICHQSDELTLDNTCKRCSNLDKKLLRKAEKEKVVVRSQRSDVPRYVKILGIWSFVMMSMALIMTLSGVGMTLGVIIENLATLFVRHVADYGALKAALIRLPICTIFAYITYRLWLRIVRRIRENQ